MRLRFVKMHGLGNDFVVTEGQAVAPDSWPDIARRVLDRRMGVGGDQLLVLVPSTKSDQKMLVFERDGSQSEMCGNGLRCAARYIVEAGHPNHSVSIETVSGIRQVMAESFECVKANMGFPVFDPQRIPTLASREVWGLHLSVGGKDVCVYALSMGNPHAVIFVEKRQELDCITSIGPVLERHEMFPSHTNVHVVFVENDENLVVRTWERSAGETLACGTGASAVSVVAMRENRVKNHVIVRYRRGTLSVVWELGKEVWVTGPATRVFQGEIEL